MPSLSYIAIAVDGPTSVEDDEGVEEEDEEGSVEDEEGEEPDEETSEQEKLPGEEDIDVSSWVLGVLLLVVFVLVGYYYVRRKER